MSKKSRKSASLPIETVGQFRVGEKFPAKGCWFSVAHVEPGVVILALEGYTQAGIDSLAQIKAKFQETLDNDNNQLSPALSAAIGQGASEDNDG
jgi:hypothetical protein